jgi:hypothetical protein
LEWPEFRDWNFLQSQRALLGDEMFEAVYQQVARIPGARPFPPEIVKGLRENGVLDCCHAAHHISLALAAMGQSEAQRMPLYREHRKLLRNGQWRRVVEELSDLADDEPHHEKLQTEIAYLRKHGEAGRLSYAHFRSLGIPLGSGAIESSIRRVINLRLKSNGMFWGEPHAETMLQVRAQVISNRWDQRLNEMRELTRHDGRHDWTWEPQAMSCKSEPASRNDPIAQKLN